MTNVLMHGCNGHMGRVITDLVKEREDIKIIAGVDINTDIKNDYPVYSDISLCKEKPDVIIDFSNAAAINPLLSYCKNEKVNLVLCTTGLSEEQLKEVDAVKNEVAVLRSANMSLGINTLLDIIKKAAKVFSPAGFDIEIVEKHHNKKLDAPSGTAIALADSINDELSNEFSYVYDRTVRREKRDKKEIGISAVRGGNIVGEHEVIFAGNDEVITFKHTAYSKGVFASGAIEAAIFLKGKAPGLYDMADVISAK